MITLPKRILKKVDQEARGSGQARSDILERVVYEYYKDKLGPALSHVNVFEDHVTLQDEELDRSVDVQIRNGHLYCWEDKTEVCEHTQFLWELPKVAEELRKHGFKERVEGKR